MRDSHGHEWQVDETEHPFLTGWKCSQCKKKTFTYDGRIPADEPKLDTACEGKK